VRRRQHWLRRAAFAAPVVALVLVGCGGTHHSAASIRATPAAALADAPPRIAVAGADDTAVVVAATRDARGRTWTSRTRVADLRRDPTRPLWTLRHGQDFFIAPFPQFEVHLDVIQHGRSVARATITRRTVGPGVVAHEVRGDLYGELLDPRAAKRGPAVLVIGGSEGGLSTTGLAAMLASHGYPAMALAYFHAPGLPTQLKDIPLEYFARALRALRRSAGGRPVVVLGISRGGEAALLIGATFPGLVQGVVALVPSNVVYPSTDGSAPAWTLRGRPVPHVRAIDVGDADPVRTPGAVIPVERIKGPILTASGGQDELWPSYLFADTLQHRLAAHHFSYPHRNLYFENAGHLLGGALPYLPTSASRRTGGTVAANEAAKAVLWPRILAFMRALQR
jgi:dienelactone hydrolase